MVPVWTALRTEPAIDTETADSDAANAGGVSRAGTVTVAAASTAPAATREITDALMVLRLSLCRPGHQRSGSVIAGRLPESWVTSVQARRADAG